MMLVQRYRTYAKSVIARFRCDRCGEDMQTELSDLDRLSPSLPECRYPGDWRQIDGRDTCAACIALRCDAIADEMLCAGG